MPAPLFTSNDSDFTKLEGLYIKEVLPPAEISGVALNDVIVCGETIRGPVGVAVSCGSPSRFREVFGGRDQGSGGTTTAPVWRALQNKPFSTLRVLRAAAAAAVAATHTFADVTPTSIIRVDASSVGQWGNNATIDIENATDGDANHFNLRVNYLGGATLYENLDVHATNFDNTLATLGDDYGNLIVITKLANGRPLNAAGTALTTGADGSIADSDFTGTNKAYELAAAVPGPIGAVFTAERSSATLKAKMNTLAAASSDRLWLMCPDASSTSLATAITDVASYRSDRVIYCFNHVYTLDGDAGAQMVVDPCSWMAAVISQTDIDIHVGEEDTKQFTAGISKLYNAGLQRADYISAKAAGICALEHDDTGFAFVSGVTTSLTPGKKEIARRRMTDFIEISLANTLKFYVKKKNTVNRRAVMRGIIENFLDGLASAERVVDRDDSKKALYKVNSEVLNTPANRALGIEKIQIKVKLIGHMLYLVLVTEIGTSVSFTESASAL